MKLFNLTVKRLYPYGSHFCAKVFLCGDNGTNKGEQAFLSQISLIRRSNLYYDSADDPSGLSIPQMCEENLWNQKQQSCISVKIMRKVAKE